MCARQIHRPLQDGHALRVRIDGCQEVFRFHRLRIHVLYYVSKPYTAMPKLGVMTRKNGVPCASPMCRWASGR